MTTTGEISGFNLEKNWMLVWILLSIVSHSGPQMHRPTLPIELPLFLDLLGEFLHVTIWHQLVGGIVILHTVVPLQVQLLQL